MPCVPQAEINKAAVLTILQEYLVMIPPEANGIPDRGTRIKVLTTGGPLPLIGRIASSSLDEQRGWTSCRLCSLDARYVALEHHKSLRKGT